MPRCFRYAYGRRRSDRQRAFLFEGRTYLKRQLNITINFVTVYHERYAPCRYAPVRFPDFKYAMLKFCIF